MTTKKIPSLLPGIVLFYDWHVAEPAFGHFGHDVFDVVIGGTHNNGPGHDVFDAHGSQVGVFVDFAHKITFGDNADQ